MDKKETIKIPSLKGNQILQKQMASDIQSISSIDLLSEKEERFCWRKRTLRKSSSSI